MSTFEEISKVNKAIKMKPIKGKNYAEVKDRIVAFRKLYPEGFIETEIIAYTVDSVTIKATVGFYEDGNRQILGEGHAWENKAKNKNINMTSMYENCETSAVGRALGMCGLGIETSVAPYEEVNRAVYSQPAAPEPEPLPESEADRKAAGEEFVGFCKKNGLVPNLVAKHFKLNGKPTSVQIMQAIDSTREMLQSNMIPAEWRG